MIKAILDDMSIEFASKKVIDIVIDAIKRDIQEHSEKYVNIDTKKFINRVEKALKIGIKEMIK